VAINDVLPLKAARRDAIAKTKRFLRPRDTSNSISHRRHGQDKTVLSSLVRVGRVQTRHDSFVLSRPTFQFAIEVSNISIITEDLENGNCRVNVCSCVHTADTDKTCKTFLSCPCRRCEQAITFTIRCHLIRLASAPLTSSRLEKFGWVPFAVCNA